ncbi:unnamed protein product [Knipowitschia caucasica]
MLGVRFLRTCCRGGGATLRGLMGVVCHHTPPPQLKAPPPKSSDSSHATVSTMKRLIQTSGRPAQVLRWISQNPSKVSNIHLVVALQRIAQLLQAPPPCARAPPPRDRKWILGQEAFLSLCEDITRVCDKIDNFDLVTSLNAAESLGLRPRSPLLAALLSECERRVDQFSQKHLSIVFSCVMRLNPAAELHRDQPRDQSEASSLLVKLARVLEQRLERERDPQTLFLLLAYYRGRQRELRSSQSECSSEDTPTDHPQQQLINRKILCLVKHTLSVAVAVSDMEMALLDEMLAAAAPEADSCSLQQIFSSELFHQRRQERFLRRLTEVLPLKLHQLAPPTVSLIAKYTARHRLREPRLLDLLSKYLEEWAEQLQPQVIQRLLFPLSRLNYRPENLEHLLQRVEHVMETKALVAPLATLNILMSMVQLQHCPTELVRTVYGPDFIQRVWGGPSSVIVRRYLSVLDSALDLDFPHYSGPRLSPDLKVQMFEPLTSDKIHRKFSYKVLVAEALRQLIGEKFYKQDQILAPGYYTDFLLWMDSSRRIIPVLDDASSFDSCVGAEPEEGGACRHHMTHCTPPNQEIRRLVLSVNDRWHYCHQSDVLIGSRDMRNRHLRLTGAELLQLPYFELEKLNGIEDVKKYVHQKLLRIADLS